MMDWKVKIAVRFNLTLLSYTSPGKVETFNELQISEINNSVFDKMLIRGVFFSRGSNSRLYLLSIKFPLGAA